MNDVHSPEERRAPIFPALVAIDLGAESCRVSLLRWHDETPSIELIHRIPNGPIQIGNHLHWPLDRILRGIEDGLRKAARAAPEGIASLAVDGWAVDYVRLNPHRTPIHLPYCYRDERSVSSKTQADTLIAPEEFFARTGAQPLRINTVYQLLADTQAGIDPSTPWLLLPEYILHWLGGRPVAEYTNATHTGLVDVHTRNWSPEIFSRLGLSLEAAPEIVPAGTTLGKLTGQLAELPAFENTELFTAACHDTASAIAAIPQAIPHDLELQTAYLVSGTWSLVGTVLHAPNTTPEAQHFGFTNQGAAAGETLFHTNVNGMWLLKQCLDHWNQQGRSIDLPTLIAQAENVRSIPGTLNVDAPDLLLAGNMPKRINEELESSHLPSIPDPSGNEPIFARLIFESLAVRYATVLKKLESLTHQRFTRLVILGGGSRNALLNRLTKESTGLHITLGEVEGSTIGNFAVQLAASERTNPHIPLSAAAIQSWAAKLKSGN